MLIYLSDFGKNMPGTVGTGFRDEDVHLRPDHLCYSPSATIPPNLPHVAGGFVIFADSFVFSGRFIQSQHHELQPSIILSVRKSERIRQCWPVMVVSSLANVFGDAMVAVH